MSRLKLRPRRIQKGGGVMAHLTTLRWIDRGPALFKASLTEVCRSVVRMYDAHDTWASAVHRIDQAEEHAVAVAKHAEMEA